jgi:hypothetical protein
MIFKTVIITLLILIMVSLAMGLFYLWNDSSGKSNRTVQSLTWRIGLSITLFLVLMLGLWMGWISPHDVNPVEPTHLEK